MKTMVKICLDEIDITCDEVKDAIEEGEVEVDFDKILQYEDGKLELCEPDCDPEFEDCNDIDVSTWSGDWYCRQMKELDELLEKCIGKVSDND